MPISPRNAWTAFRRDRRGVAAVEFAMILPLMLVFFIGTIDITSGVLSSRKVGLVSRTIADLVSQQPTTTTTTPSTISTIFTASSAIMQPFSTSNITLTVSSVTIKAKSNGNCCDAMVDWSYTQGGTLRTCGVALTQAAAGAAPTSTNIPAALITANQQAGYLYTSSNVTYLVIADVSYKYQPLFPQAATWFASAFRKTSFIVPRSASGRVSLSSATPALSTQSAVICP